MRSLSSAVDDFLVELRDLMLLNLAVVVPVSGPDEVVDF
jgi:hypothetical protein